MSKKIILIMIFCFNFLYAELSDIYIKEVVNDYKPTKNEKVWSYDEEIVTKICTGYNVLSISCEIITLELENSLRKKKINFLLDEISNKFNINKQIISNLKKNFFKYIEDNPRIHGSFRYCSSTICTFKDIKYELITFEEILLLILDGKKTQLKNDLNIQTMKKLFKDTSKRLNCLEINFRGDDTFEGKIYKEGYFTREKSDNFFKFKILWEDLESSFISLTKEINIIEDNNLLKSFYFLGYHELLNSTGGINNIATSREWNCKRYEIPNIK